MRAQIRRAIVSCALLLAGACTPSPEPPNQRELAAYMTQLTQWAPQEAEVGRAVRRILETEFADEAEVRRQMAESAPRLDAQLALLRAYHPSNATLQALHASYVEAWEILRGGYDDIQHGLDTSDQTALARGRNALLTWRRAIPAMADRLRTLGAKNDAGPST